MMRPSAVRSGLIAVAFVAGPMMLEGQKSVTSRQTPAKIQLQLQGYVGQLAAHELRMMSVKQLWDPGKNQFLDPPVKGLVLQFDTKIEAISPDGWMRQTRKVVRIQEGVDSTITFDSADPEAVRALMRDPSRAEWFRRITTPFTVLQASTGEVRGAAVDKPGVDLEQPIVEKNAVFRRTPVALYETWSTGKHVYSVPTRGQLTATGTATLQDVRMERGELVAEIVETAVATFKPDEERMAKYTMRDFSFRGRYRLLVERGVLLQSTREVSFVLVTTDGSEQPVRYVFGVELVAGR